VSEPGGLRAPRRAPRPTARGWAVAAVGAVLVVAGLAGRRQDLVLLGLVLVLAVAGSLLTLRWSRPRIEVRRSVRPDAVSAGDEAEVVIVARGADAGLVERAWHDELPADLVAHRRHAMRSAPGTGATRVVQYALRAARRGRYAVGPLRVRRVDALGLARLDASIGEAATLLVSPRVVPLDDSPLDDSAAGGTELVVMRRTTPSVDEVSAREYQRGDPLRRINWRASAKRGRLMVRQEEQRSNPQSWLLLDTVGAPLVRPSDAFELGIELVASIGAHALARGFALGVVETGEAQLQGEAMPYGAGYQPPDGARLLVTELAGIRPARRAGDPIGAFADALRRGGAGTSAFAVLIGGPSEWWSELAGLRGLAEPCVAFLLTERAAEARPGLQAAGWACVVVEPAMGVAEAWAAAETAGRRGGSAP